MVPYDTLKHMAARAPAHLEGRSQSPRALLSSRENAYFY